MIYCEFVVKIMCTYRKEKKKKKENSNYGNGIAETGGEDNGASKAWYLMEKIESNEEISACKRGSKDLVFND